MFASTAQKSVDINVWATHLVGVVVARLEQRIRDFESNPAPGKAGTTIEQQQRKFDFLKYLIKEHHNYQPDPERGQRHTYSQLHRIIKGFLVEFLSQSEDNIQPVNVEHNRNPEAKKFWDGLQPDALARAKFSGCFHVAASYNHLRRSYLIRGINPAKFHAIGDIIRASIDVFKEEHPKLQLSSPTRASIHNDHPAALKFASSLRNFDTVS